MTEFSNQGSQLPLRSIKGYPRDHAVKGDKLTFSILLYAPLRAKDRWYKCN